MSLSLYLRTLLISLLIWMSSPGHALNELQPADIYEEIAIRYVQAVNQRDAKLLSSLINFDRLADRAVASAKLEGAEARDFKSGMLESANGSFAQRYISRIQQAQGQAIYVRRLNRQGKIRPLIRMDMGEQGYAYLELIVDQNADSQIEIIDWYTNSLGQKLSDSIGGIARLFLKPDKHLFEQVLGVNRIDQDTLDRFMRIINYRREQNYQAAYAEMQALPDKVRNTRIMIGIAIDITHFVSEQSYINELKRLERHFADDPSASFLLIDYYFYENDFARGIRAIEVFESDVGVDGVTLFLKSSMASAAGKHKSSIAYATQSIELEPYLEEPYWMLVTGYLYQKNYHNVVKTLDLLGKNFGYQFKDENFQSEALYADFIKSSDYKQWIARRQVQ